MTVPGSGDNQAVVDLLLRYNSTKSKMELEKAEKDIKGLKGEQKVSDTTLKSLDRELAVLNKAGKSYAAAYQQRAKEAQKATNEVIKAERKLATEQKRIESEAVKARKEAEKEYVESYRRQIQAKLDATTKKPREQEDVLRAAGMSDAMIKRVNVELNRAGGSAAGITKALQRMNIPATQARGIAIAMKEAANEAGALQRDLTKTFYTWRRISEQGVRLSEVGFILGAGGAAILAPLTLAATQYTERFRSLEDEAARFTAVQNAQKEAISDLGREASVALLPVMEMLLDVLKQIVQVVKDNPGLLQAAVLGGAGLAGVGTAMVLFGRIESVIGRLGAIFFSNMPGSINLPGLLGFGVERTTGFAGGFGQGIAGVGLKAGLSVAVVAALDAAILKVIDSLAETVPFFDMLKSRMDITGDGVLDLNDVLAALRTGVAIAITTLVDGFFRVATAIANFISILGELPERIKNWTAGNGFLTDAGVQQQAQRGTLVEQIKAVQQQLTAPGLTDDQLRAQRETLQQALEAERQQMLSSMSGPTAEFKAITDELAGINEELRRRETGETGKTTEDLVAELQTLTAALEALDAGGLGGMSPAGQAIEAERQRILQEMAPSMAEFVRSGTIGGGGGGGRAIGTGPSDTPARPTGPTPEELALFGAYRNAELQAERQYQVQLADLNRQRRIQELDAEREYARNVQQMHREQARKERDMLEDHALDLQKAQIDYARKEADIERKRQFDRLQKLREHELKLTELAAARDVGGFVEAQKQFALEQMQEEKQAAFDKAQRQREFDIERADKEREFQLNLAQARRAFQEQLADAERNYQTQKAERERQYQEQLAQMRTEQDRQRQERLRDYAQQLDDLRVSQGVLSDERKAYNDAIIAGYKELLANHSLALQQALQQAYGLPAAGTPGAGAGGNRSVTLHPGGGSHYATGSRYIPTDQWAGLHAGERVLTASQNRAYGPMLDQMDRGGWPMPQPKIININVTGNAFGKVAALSDVHEMGMEIVNGLGDALRAI